MREHAELKQRFGTTAQARTRRNPLPRIVEVSAEVAAARGGAISFTPPIVHHLYNRQTVRRRFRRTNGGYVLLSSKSFARVAHRLSWHQTISPKRRDGHKRSVSCAPTPPFRPSARGWLPTQQHQQQNTTPTYTSTAGDRRQPAQTQQKQTILECRTSSYLLGRHALPFLQDPTWRPHGACCAQFHVEGPDLRRGEVRTQKGKEHRHAKPPKP